MKFFQQIREVEDHHGARLHLISNSLISLFWIIGARPETKDSIEIDDLPGYDASVDETFSIPCEDERRLTAKSTRYLAWIIDNNIVGWSVTEHGKWDYRINFKHETDYALARLTF